MWHLAPCVVGSKVWKESMITFLERPSFEEIVSETHKAWALLLVENHWKAYWSKNKNDDGTTDYSGMTYQDEDDLKRYEVMLGESTRHRDKKRKECFGMYITNPQAGWNKEGVKKYAELLNLVDADRDLLGTYMDRAMGELVDMHLEKTQKKRKKKKPVVSEDDIPAESYFRWKRVKPSIPVDVVHTNYGSTGSAMTEQL
mmetsp:Transcript_13535/g.30728  ORF Transcript_13535/g.30728 Transcript_13535/m.30728 type:complete len:200 (+) Transcript_13535:297-896(+)